MTGPIRKTPAAAGTWWRATWFPEINGYLDGLRKSQKFVIENRAVFERAGQAVMAKIMENEKAAAALALTGPGRVAIPAVNAPDLQRKRRKGRREDPVAPANAGAHAPRDVADAPLGGTGCPLM